MKKALLTLTLLAATQMTYSQAKYNFSKTTGTYTGITGGIEILPGNKHFDTVALGFDVEINGFKNDTLYIRSLGTVGLGVAGSEADAFYADMVDGKQHYTVTGNPGERLLIIEFKDTRFGHDFGAMDYTNFQLWIYEKDGVIEMHYGDISVNNPDFSYYYQNGGPAVGFRGQQLKGSPSAPVEDTGYVYMSGTPSNGLIYRFEPRSLNIENSHAQETVSIYPNPGDGKFTITLQDAQQGNYKVQVYDVTGRQIRNQDIHGQQSDVDISNAQPGMYFIRMSHDGQAVQTFTYLFE